MPPKKDSKKEAASKPDNSGIPKRDIEFKFSFAIRSESSQPPNIAIMFEWFAGISDKFERNESPLLQSWKKDEKSYLFDKDCDLIRVDDDFCKALCTRKFYIYFVNGEDSKVEDRLLMDYSFLLTAANPVQYSFESNIIRALGIDSFSLKITADKALLQDVYKHYLNPLEVQVIGSKDLPVEKSSRYEPTYVKFGFFDGSEAETPALVGSDKLLWSHKHVFLAGMMNATELKQKMRSRYLKFELHDRDEIMNRKAKPDIELFDIGKAIQQELQKQKPVEQDPKKKGAKKEEKKEVKKEVKKDAKKKDAKLGQPVFPEQLQYQRNNYGVAAFSLVQFLKPTTRTARYKAPVVPRNAYEDLQSKNLDLNTTARNEMHSKVISSNNYFDCDTVLVVGFTLAHPIGTFVAPQPVLEVEDPKKKKDAKDVAPVVQKKEAKKQVARSDVFERVVYVVPYKDAQTVKTIEQIFYSANLKAFGLKNRRQITTHLLKPEQQRNNSLDYITGLQICDPEGRLFILQGLREGAMKQFGQKIVRSAPNSKEFKILKNTNVGFSHRLFATFHLQLKRIRLRPSLSQLLLQPSIYIKSKVPQELSQTLVKLADARKIPDNLLSFQAMNLWPNAEALLQIQRKFSQSLSNQDITGTELPRRETTYKPGETSQTVKLFQNTEVGVFTTDEFFHPKEAKVQTPPAVDLGTTSKRLVMTKTFTKDHFGDTQSYKMRGQRAEIGQNQPVYIYAGQKLNYYDKQMKDFRQKMEPNAIYTYDRNHFNLSIDPHTVEDEKKRELEMSLSKMYSKDKFSSLVIKTKDQRMKLPNKPSDQDILDLLNYPYHQQQTRQKELAKNLRDLPLKGDKQEFQKYLRPKEIFSVFIPLQGQKLSPVQQQKLQREKREKEKQAQKSLLKGSPVLSFKKGYSLEKAYGVDRLKDIREGQAKKLGLIDKHKKDGEKRTVLPYEASFNLSERAGDPAYNPLIRRDDSLHNIQKDEFNFYQRPEILTRTQIYKPLKDIL